MRRKRIVAAFFAMAFWLGLAALQAVLRHGPDIIGVPGMIDDAGVGTENGFLVQ